MIFSSLRSWFEQRFSSRANALQELMASQSFAGLLLAAAAFLALLLSNSPWSAHYNAVQQFAIQLRLGDVLDLNKPLQIWVDDLGMAAFFFLVGLEIKREWLQGQLADRKAALLPAFAALGGMVVPALIYAALNRGDAAALRGWAIPSATDIAFALGVLALLGSRVPPALKVLLTAIAILDDLGAILIIAFVYTAQLNWAMLNAALWCLTALVLMNRLGVRRLSAYLCVGLLLWVFLLKSGVHATLAGVLTALCVPLRVPLRMPPRLPSHGAQHNPLEGAMHRFHPWVTFLVLPAFAFLNAGVDLRGASWGSLVHGVPLGIVLGLLLGKPLGIFSSLWAGSKITGQGLPAGCRWSHIFGMSVLCGIGFTMSLFIGELAFAGRADFEMALKMGVLLASLLAALLGSAVFVLIRPKMRAARPQFTVVKS